MPCAYIQARATFFLLGKTPLDNVGLSKHSSTHPPQESELFLTQGKGEHCCHVSLTVIRLQSCHLPAVNKSLHLCVIMIPEFLLEKRSGSGWQESWVALQSLQARASRLQQMQLMAAHTCGVAPRLSVAGISLEMTSCGVGGDITLYK